MMSASRTWAPRWCCWQEWCSRPAAALACGFEPLVLDLLALLDGNASGETGSSGGLSASSKSVDKASCWSWSESWGLPNWSARRVGNLRSDPAAPSWSRRTSWSSNPESPAGTGSAFLASLLCVTVTVSGSSAAGSGSSSMSGSGVAGVTTPPGLCTGKTSRSGLASLQLYVAQIW